MCNTTKVGAPSLEHVKTQDPAQLHGGIEAVPFLLISFCLPAISHLLCPVFHPDGQLQATALVRREIVKSRDRVYKVALMHSAFLMELKFQLLKS